MDVFDFQCASSSFCLKLLAFLLTYFSNVCRLFGYIYFRQCHHLVESSSSFFQSFGRFHSSHFGKLEMEQINRELANLSRGGKRVFLNLEIREQLPVTFYADDAFNSSVRVRPNSMFREQKVKKHQSLRRNKEKAFCSCFKHACSIKDFGGWNTFCPPFLLTLLMT